MGLQGHRFETDCLTNTCQNADCQSSQKWQFAFEVLYCGTLMLFSPETVQLGMWLKFCGKIAPLTSNKSYKSNRSRMASCEKLEYFTSAYLSKGSKCTQKKATSDVEEETGKGEWDLAAHYNVHNVKMSLNGSCLSSWVLQFACLNSLMMNYYCQKRQEITQY